MKVGDTVLFFKNPTAEPRAAIVVRIWNPDVANVQVLVDGNNDVGMFTPEECKRGNAWRTSVPLHDPASGEPKPSNERLEVSPA